MAGALEWIDRNADGVEPASGPPAAHDDEPVPPRSHRRGMLAGLGVVGLLLAGLLLFGPGGARPRPAAQGQAGQSPVTIPLRSEATTPAPSTTTTSAPPAPTAQTGPVTDLAASTYQLRAATAPHAPAPTPSPGPTVPRPTAAAATTTTTTAAVAPPPTTTTTSPPVTTTTLCLLVLCD